MLFVNVNRSTPIDVHNLSSPSLLVWPSTDSMMAAAKGYPQPSQQWDDFTLSLQKLDQSSYMWPFTQIISFVVRSRYEADRSDLIAGMFCFRPTTCIHLTCLALHCDTTLLYSSTVCRQ